MRVQVGDAGGGLTAAAVAAAMWHRVLVLLYQLRFEEPETAIQD
jgi:hypothetical protein